MAPTPPAYDRIGIDYAIHRRPDPSIDAAIRAALGSARSVVNVGAGTGGYEPDDRRVVAVEPSRVMIAQRPPGSAPVVAAVGEALPFADRAFDATLAVLTLHHWPDPARGLAELQRVASRHVVLTWDPVAVLAADFWLTRDYFPALHDDLVRLAALAVVLGAFPDAEVQVLPIPHDCRDGFMAAYWRRPEAYLDPAVRSGISSFAARDDAELADGLARLAGDLESGRWHDRNRDLLEQAQLDLGYRLVVAQTP
jgi:SAM-dependent methyltransferase